MNEIQSLARGLKILDLLGQSSEGISITELSEHLAVDKGSASRLVATLTRYGYVEKDEITHRYHVGSRVVSLSRSVLTRLPLREAAKPYLRQMMEISGECSHIGIAAQGKVLYIDQVESPVSLRVNAQVGTLSPLHCTALGKVLLAFSDIPLPVEMPSFTDKTITDPIKLRQHLERVQQQGYAVDDEEFDIGVRCIAVPVFDFRGKAVGAIGVSGPAVRMTLGRIAELSEQIMEIGRTLSERMNFKR